MTIIIFAFSCNEHRRFEDKSLTDYQKQVNDFFKDASVSPLKTKDLKNFRGLDFFKFDSSFLVYAKIQETPENLPFKMMMTIANTPANFRKYGILKFSINDEYFELSVYENLDYFGLDEYENYLFLPFLDKTSGYETYGGGRYIDLYQKNSDSILIDFNRAYNPKCVYNENFSCPIVPRENYLNIRIEAGVKNFVKN
tara:strand:+ start:2650 stop:3240 length:591 start_codon:yes stop_codon:yes gene_type:complete